MDDVEDTELDEDKDDGLDIWELVGGIFDFVEEGVLV